MLPRGRHDATALITSAPGVQTAIFLDGQFPFSSFACGDNTSWNGILVSGVTIEMDETSVLDSDARTPPGTLVRRQSELIIIAKLEGNFHGHPGRVAVINNLPPCRESQSAGFTRWRILVGEGLHRREIKSINVSVVPDTSPPNGGP
jgi:hypothetical protein